ncbi:MAG: hypothetical protein Q4E01_01685 [Actinomycetaceae bacterium]|nr:hypothetical protein [Actinomycetaceae bacterium]
MSNQQPSLLGDESAGRVARVLVDTPVPHLDRLFDYAIGEHDVQVGSLVRVKMSGRRMNGFVIEIAEHSEFEGKLAPIERVVSAVPLVNERMINLGRDLARRNGTSLAKVLGAMVPDRHASAEKSFLSHWNRQAGMPSPGGVGTPSDIWNFFAGGAALLKRIGSGESPRAVWQLLPGVYPATLEPHPFVDLVRESLNSGRRALIVVPTAKDVTQTARVFEDTGWKIATQSSEDTKYRRYKTYLEILSGGVDVVIGTRSSVYSPLPNLGLILVVDSGDDRLSDPQAPYLSALDIAIRRSHLEGAALVSAGMSISIAEAQLIQSRWAPPLVPDLEVMRAKTAQVQVPDDFDRDREGPAGYSRIPPSVQSFIRRSLDEGPVLVHVPSSGWVSVIVCDRCGQGARCSYCHGPLRGQADGSLSCMWCDRPQVGWRCNNCAGTKWRSTRVGSARTAEEFGRAFPGVIIEMADGDHPVQEFTKTSGIVIATPGSEPVATEGYAGAVVLDASAILGRPELWAPSEAIRRWMNVLGLVRPEGKMVIVGVRDQMIRQALIRRDPLGFARRLLDEREQLRFFPSVCMVAIDGDRKDVDSFTSELTVPKRCELVGIAPRVGRDVQKTFGPDQTRAIYRCPWDSAQTFIDSVRTTQIARSMKRAGAVSVRVNPSQLI